MQWNWNAEKTKRWLEPALEMPYLAEKWTERGFHTVLDNGCGPGRHAMYFARHGFEVTGFDQSQEALDYLKSWSESENLSVHCVQGQIQTMPFADSSFDAIVDYNASYHTDSEGFKLAILQICRVLRPRGELFMTLLSQNAPGFINAHETAHIDANTVVHDGGTPHFYAGRNDLKTLFEGFEPVIPVREVTMPGLDSKAESTHYHLLLRKP